MIGATMTAVGTPAADKRLERAEPLGRRRCARLHGARELGIERRHRHRHLDQLVFRHLLQNVEIAQHQRRSW